jgi:hypothetical protein
LLEGRERFRVLAGLERFEGLVVGRLVATGRWRTRRRRRGGLRAEPLVQIRVQIPLLFAQGLVGVLQHFDAAPQDADLVLQLIGALGQGEQALVLHHPLDGGRAGVEITQLALQHRIFLGRGRTTGQPQAAGQGQQQGRSGGVHWT